MLQLFPSNTAVAALSYALKKSIALSHLLVLLGSPFENEIKQEGIRLEVVVDLRPLKKRRYFSTNKSNSYCH